MSNQTIVSHAHGIIGGAILAMCASLGIDAYLVMGFLLKIIVTSVIGILGGISGGIGSSIWNHFKHKFKCKK